MDNNVNNCPRLFLVASDLNGVATYIRTTYNITWHTIQIYKYILDTCPSSDHLPVRLMISTALTAERCVNNEKHANKIFPIFRWSNAKDCNIKEYGKYSAVHLDRIHISDSCTCTNSNCSNIQHISDIDHLFDDICNALRVSSLETITTCKKTLCQGYIVPGWNDYVKEAHTEARYYYILWRDMGKPKHGPVWEVMPKTSRCHG